MNDQLGFLIERTTQSELEKFEPTRHEASLTRDPDCKSQAAEKSL